MADTDADMTMAGADTTLNSAAGSAAQPRAKKARTEGNGSQMDVDDEMNDASDPEDVPVEDDDEDDVQEEEEEEEEEDDDQDGGDNEEEEQDELEEREDQPDEDEALDDGNHSD